jgi:hypothetical protein
MSAVSRVFFVPFPQPMIKTLEPAYKSGFSVEILGSLMGLIWSVNFTAESRTERKIIFLMKAL